TESGIFDPQKDEEGIYPYVVSKKGCEPDTALISIIVHPLPQIDLGQDITVTFYDTIVHLIAGTNIDQYSQIEWYINGGLQDVQDEDMDIVIDDNKEIRVVIYDENGCEAMDTLLITVDFKVNIYVPNIFTPDGDGINDIWRLGFKGYKPDMLEGAIYNRWGEKIIYWGSNDNIEWDGTFKGKKVLPGVYVYYIKYKTLQGDVSVLTGDVTVVR
ncbi:MAG TPA: gliding motility-associated C-terminal domain-containing protein, partial [Bacteroidetes bacterium]|nr:gliding motility-associated C-terminal domain-containing protein [Bacteroidota bacterium]